MVLSDNFCPTARSPNVVGPVVSYLSYSIRSLYVEHLTHSAGPMVRFSAGSTWYVHRTSVYVYVYLRIRS